MADIDAYVARIVADAPPLTADQIDRIARLLAPTRKTPPGAPTGSSHLLEPGGTGSTLSSSTGGTGVDCG